MEIKYNKKKWARGIVLKLWLNDVLVVYFLGACVFYVSCVSDNFQEQTNNQQLNTRREKKVVSSFCFITTPTTLYQIRSKTLLSARFMCASILFPVRVTIIHKKKLFRDCATFT